jgi:hypothetical protein
MPCQAMSLVVVHVAGNVSGTRLRPRLRVPESWRGPGHNELYGAGPVGSHLMKLNYEALCIGLPRCHDN